MKWVLIIISLVNIYFCNAQDTTVVTRNWSLNGYVKNLESLTFDKSFKNNISGSLLHNRLNFKWKPSTNITATVEIRNRIFWGEEVKSIPEFEQQIRNDIEAVNMQKAWINNPGMVFHTNVERLNIEYRHSKWNLRAGRQRINWGITTTWNPNDIFNTFNFLDFDYEERPGVDGIRFQYFFNSAFNAEAAYINTGEKEGNVAAVKYNLNKWGYNLQLITGWYKEDITVGGGFAGNLKDAGIKGEVQYYFHKQDTIDHLNLSLEGDYMFAHGWYLNTGLLFNKNGLYKSIGYHDIINLKLSPQSLMPTKWNFIVTTAKEISPLFSVNMSILYSPGTNLFILFPSLRYNLDTNLDADLVWQTFFAELDSNFEAVSHRVYLRLKWSF